MTCRLALLALALVPIAALADPPSYSASSLVSLASGSATDLAPNTLVSLTGKNLSLVTRARTADDLQAGLLPYTLPGTGVTVRVGGLLATLESVSPEEVIFLIPAELRPGTVTVVLTRNSLQGPTLRVKLNEVAPALFLYEEGRVLARHAETLEWVNGDLPALPGESIVLYAAGLGALENQPSYRTMPVDTLPVARAAEWRVVLDGVEVVPDSVTVLPGWPGLYQVLVRLPETLAAPVEVWLRLEEVQSQSGVKLPVEPIPPQPVDAALRL